MSASELIITGGLWVYVGKVMKEGKGMKILPARATGTLGTPRL